MSMIQGIGDEVIEFFIILGLVTIGLIAWWSTSINHRPLIRTVLIFEHRTRSRVSTTNHSGLSNTEAPRNATDSEPNEPNEEQAEQTVESEDIESEVLTDSAVPSSDEIEQNAIVETMDSDAAVVRQRRLSFFKKSTNEAKPEEDEAHSSTQSNSEQPEPIKVEPTKSSPIEKDDDLIRIKLKFLNDNIRAVEGKKREKLGDFKRRHFEVEISECKLVRLIFNGQVLQRDTDTLQKCGLFDNCVVHCLVIQQQSRTNPGEPNESSIDRNHSTRSTSFASTTPSNTSQTSQNQWDFGNILFAIVTLLLTGAWYFRYEYAQLFTITATVLLVCLTGIFTLIVIGFIYPDAPVVIETQTADATRAQPS